MTLKKSDIDKRNYMSKRYTQEEKEYMATMAIEIVEKLNGQYPFFQKLCLGYSTYFKWWRY